MVMDEEISFVLAETIAGNRDKKEEVRTTTLFILLINIFLPLNRLRILGLLKKKEEKWIYKRYVYLMINTLSHIYIHTCIHTYIHIFIVLHTYIRTYIHTYTHTYIHTYIHAYIHTCIHTYIHTHTYIQTRRSLPIYPYRESLLEAIETHQVSYITQIMYQ